MLAVPAKSKARATRQYSCGQEARVQIDVRTLQQSTASRRIDAVDRITLRVGILVQRARSEYIPKGRIHVFEPTRQVVIVTRSQVVQVEIAVEALAAVQIRIRDRSRACDGHTESVELVSIANRARGAGGEADVAVAVVAVKARRPRAADQLVLADALQAVGVGLCHRAADQFVSELRVSF